jgi:hypothetical protein
VALVVLDRALSTKLPSPEFPIRMLMFSSPLETFPTDLSIILEPN